MVLELFNRLAAELGHEIDIDACNQIKNRTYVDDGAGGGSLDQVNHYRRVFVNGEYMGTIPKILNLVGLKLKLMVASGDRDSIKLLGDKVFGHAWEPTDDKFIFRIVVNLTPARFKKRGTSVAADLTEAHIPRLVHMKLTKRYLLGLIDSQYDPMVLIWPILMILKINLRDLFGPEVDIG